MCTCLCLPTHPVSARKACVLSPVPAHVPASLCIVVLHTPSPILLQSTCFRKPFLTPLSGTCSFSFLACGIAYQALSSGAYHNISVPTHLCLVCPARMQAHTEHSVERTGFGRWLSWPQVCPQLLTICVNDHGQPSLLRPWFPRLQDEKNKYCVQWFLGMSEKALTLLLLSMVWLQ